MTTLRVEIDKEKDLTLLQKVLTELGFKFSLEDDSYESLPAFALQGIREGLDDVEAGKAYTHEIAMARIEEKISQLRLRNAGQ